jgi:hypothetical protein
VAAEKARLTLAYKVKGLPEPETPTLTGTALA